jgi:hypothetical protein
MHGILRKYVFSEERGDRLCDYRRTAFVGEEPGKCVWLPDPKFGHDIRNDESVSGGHAFSGG